MDTFWGFRTFDKDFNLDIDGRLKRLIIRRGFKISAIAIENVIMTNDKVEYCAVVKAPHEEDGEIPFVYVVLKDQYLNDSDLVENELKDLCLKKLPEYYIPNNYSFVKSLPYTKNGKLDIISLEKDALNQVSDELNKHKSR